MLIGLSGILVLLSLVASAAQGAEPEKQTGSGASESICLLIEAAASANGLPRQYFTRVIWQESRLRPNVVGPLTRGGRRAEGIAQFMPETAAERGLFDPFDPVKALPKSAEYLRELLAEFGNLGLAAAAYNAGPRRVHDWLAGRGRLPDQTRAYVLAITGHSVDEWIRSDRESAAPSGADAGEQSCDELTALFTANTHGQKSTTPPTDMQSTHRWQPPSWCKHLNRPRKELCGTAHATEPIMGRSNSILRHHSRS